MKGPNNSRAEHLPLQVLTSSFKKTHKETGLLAVLSLKWYQSLTNAGGLFYFPAAVELDYSNK